MPPKSALDETDQHLALAMDAWKFSVSVQMHFNDIEMKVRNLYFTILAASLGLIGVAQGKRLHLDYPPITISLSLLVVASIIPISMLFYFIDRHWYHRLLQGAVAHCVEIENRYGNELPDIQMGRKISLASPVEFKGFWKILFFFIKDKRFREGSMLHSDQKIEVLYKSVIWSCLAILVIYGVINGVQYKGCAALEWAVRRSCHQPLPVLFDLLARVASWSGWLKNPT